MQPEGSKLNLEGETVSVLFVKDLRVYSFGLCLLPQRQMAEAVVVGFPTCLLQPLANWSLVLPFRFPPDSI